MRVNINKLKGKIIECGLTQERVAASLEMNRSTFCRKMSSAALEFSIGDMHALCNLLCLSNDEALEIFLSD